MRNTANKIIGEFLSLKPDFQINPNDIQDEESFETNPNMYKSFQYKKRNSNFINKTDFMLPQKTEL